MSYGDMINIAERDSMMANPEVFTFMPVIVLDQRIKVITSEYYLIYVQAGMLKNNNWFILLAHKWLLLLP